MRGKIEGKGRIEGEEGVTESELRVLFRQQKRADGYYKEDVGGGSAIGAQMNRKGE